MTRLTQKAFVLNTLLTRFEYVIDACMYVCVSSYRVERALCLYFFCAHRFQMAFPMFGDILSHTNCISGGRGRKLYVLKIQISTLSFPMLTVDNKKNSPPFLRNQFCFSKIITPFIPKVKDSFYHQKLSRDFACKDIYL